MQTKPYIIVTTTTTITNTDTTTATTILGIELERLRQVCCHGGEGGSPSVRDCQHCRGDLGE